MLKLPTENAKSIIKSASEKDQKKMQGAKERYRDPKSSLQYQKKKYQENYEQVKEYEKKKYQENPKPKKYEKEEISGKF